MIWPWSKPPPPPVIVVIPPEKGEGEKAREDAVKHLAEADAQWAEVHRVSTSLRELRQRNHFGETIQRLIEEGRKPA